MDTAPEIQSSPPTGGSDLCKEEADISKFVTMSNPEYIVFTDSELEQVRHSYFEEKTAWNWAQSDLIQGALLPAHKKHHD